MRLLLASLLAGLASAPAFGVQVAPVRVISPIGGSMSAAGAVQAELRISNGLSNPLLGVLASPQIAPNLAPPTLTPSVIPVAPAPEVAPQGLGGLTATPLVSPQEVSAAPGASPVLEGGAVQFEKKADGQAGAPAAVETLKGLVNRMESSRLSGGDLSSSLSERFFDQSGNRGPPVAAPAQTKVSDPAAPQLPPGVKSVSVETVRTAADVERLIPEGPNSRGLKAGLKASVSEMAPYQIYTYKDSRGGRFTGIDLSANPGLVDRIPELQQHEVKLIKKLLLVDSSIRVLVREDGKTPDLVVGDRLVEIKSWAGMSLPLEALINKANRQVFEHARRHGLGHGALAVDMTRETSVPVERVRGLLNSWQAGVQGGVVLDKVIVFGGTDMKVFVRQADGTYEPGDPRAAVARVASERPVTPKQASAVKGLLRQGRVGAAHQRLRGLGVLEAETVLSSLRLP